MGFVKSGELLSAAAGSVVFPFVVACVLNDLRSSEEFYPFGLEMLDQGIGVSTRSRDLLLLNQ